MLVVGAVAAAPASAKLSESGGAPCLSGCSTAPGTEVTATGGYDLGRVAYTAPTITSASSGFDWGDAGIGAGAALVIIATASGGAVMFGRRHAHGHHLAG
jgi:hypothetical protein